MVIIRRKPGPGAQHLLKVEDIRRFIEIIPNWEELSAGLDAVVLVPYSRTFFGQYSYSSVIKISAWVDDEWYEMHPENFERDKYLIEMLDVPYERLDWGFECKFTTNQVKAFQLLGTFLHELGHHVDRMNCRGKKDCPGGEPFAIKFEKEMIQKVWPEFVKRFPLP